MERERKIYMNVVFFFFSLPKYHLAKQTLGSPGECAGEQVRDGADSRDGVSPPRVATARKGPRPLVNGWPLSSQRAVAHLEPVS